MEVLFRWFTIVLSAALFIFVDAISTQWAKSNKLLFLFLMISFGTFAYVFFGKIAKNSGLSIASALINTLVMVGSILVGIFFFRDQISFRQGVGIILAILAVILLAF